MSEYVRVEDGDVVAHGLPATGEIWVDEPVMVEQPVMRREPELDAKGKPTGKVRDVPTGQKVMVPHATRTERVRATVSGFDQLDPATLKAEGWLPLDDPGAPDVQPGQLVDRAYEVMATAVKAIYTVTDAPEPEPGPDLAGDARAAIDAAFATGGTPDDLHAALHAIVDLIAGPRADSVRG